MYTPNTDLSPDAAKMQNVRAPRTIQAGWMCDRRGALITR
jgi:hypothetical protein